MRSPAGYSDLISIIHRRKKTPIVSLSLTEYVMYKKAVKKTVLSMNYLLETRCYKNLMTKVILKMVYVQQSPKVGL